MKGTITISSSFGAGGAYVGPAVAAELGLEFFDRAIPVAVAHDLHIDLEDAIAQDSKAPGRLERLLSALANISLPIGLPDVPSESTMTPNRFKDATETVLRQIADGDGGVILGRASMVVLAGRPDVLSVRLSGPVEERIAQHVARSGEDLAKVRAEQKETDAAREAYVQLFYGAGQADMKLYHLGIDSTVISYETCTAMIVAAARDRFGE